VGVYLDGYDQRAVRVPFVDPMLTMLLSAPEDEEDLSDEDLAAIGEGDADIAHGNVVSHEDVKRRFGIS
jgi:predicted transcriptional regulator